MISFVNLARIASICVGFDLGTLYGYSFHQDFWSNMNFPLECQIKLVLTSKKNLPLTSEVSKIQYFSIGFQLVHFRIKHFLSWITHIPCFDTSGGRLTIFWQTNPGFSCKSY